MTLTIKLQSPDYDGSGNGSEIPLPVVNTRHVASSLAAIITLFEGDNQILDFKQLREVFTLQCMITPRSAQEAGFTNAAGDGIPLFMRDEIRRTRGASTLGLHGGGSASSWLDEGVSGGNWGSAGLPAAERDSGTLRAPGKIRLIFDKAWDPVADDYQNLFVYGTVGDFNFVGAAASHRERIPAVITFLGGSVTVQ